MVGTATRQRRPRRSMIFLLLLTVIAISTTSHAFLPGPYATQVDHSTLSSRNIPKLTSYSSFDSILRLTRNEEQVDNFTTSDMGNNLEGIILRGAADHDLRVASKILTDAFFSFSIFSTPFEWLNTYLSLRDSLVKTSDQYYIFVACDSINGSVVGICEVDSRSYSSPGIAPRPYVCNLAIDKKWRKKGIGNALMKLCEEKARDQWNESFLHLRVRKKNVDAIGFYSHLGYEIDKSSQPSDKISGEEIILMKKLLEI